MKNFLLTTGFLLAAVCASGQVTSTGGFVSNGSPGAGTVACSAGTEPGFSLTAIGFTCPSSFTTGFYFVMPTGATGANMLPIVAGATDASGNVPLSYGTYKGNTTAVCTAASGAFTNAHLLEADSNSNVADSGIGASGVVLGAGNLTTQYGLPYTSNVNGTVVQLGPNTATKPAFLTMTGTGTAGGTPAWSAISGSTATVTTANANVTSTNSGNYLSIDSNGNAQSAGVTTGPYSLPWFVVPTLTTTATVTVPKNLAALFGVVLSYPITTSQVSFYLTTANNSSSVHYDIGFYCDQAACGSYTSGQLVVSTGQVLGTTFAPATGWLTTPIPWTTATTLQPGKYLLAMTTDSSSAAVLAGGGGGNGVTFYANSAGTGYTTSVGTLSATITAPSDAYNNVVIPSVQAH